ncbi:VanZ family protein [candidate division KSB1 bacterium]|nr:VanZ family protein [candidate division KSB1 bacterium]
MRAFIIACMLIAGCIQPVQAQVKTTPDTIKSLVLKSKQKIKQLPFQINQSDTWHSKDKVDHLLSSALLCAGTLYWARSEQNWSLRRSRIVGVSIPLAIGLLKELWDGFQPNHVASWKDVYADVAGIGVGFVMFNE